MLLVYAIFMLFYSWFVIMKYRKMNKNGSLINELTQDEQKKLFLIVFIVFLLLLLFTGYQSFDFFISIFNSDIELFIDLPVYLEEYAIFANIGLSVLKVIWIPMKITKYILQIIFGTLSIFIFYCRYCLKEAKKLPNYLRNILYVLSFINIVYILVAIF